jgi:hypothetical protein
VLRIRIRIIWPDPEANRMRIRNQNLATRFSTVGFYLQTILVGLVYYKLTPFRMWICIREDIQLQRNIQIFLIFFILLTILYVCQLT